MSEFLEQRLDSKEIFTGKIFTVTQDRVQLKNGHVAIREVVHHNGGAAILALREDGCVAMVRQYRYAVGRDVLEIPAGKVEADEAPLETARRELREEAGLIADSLVPFASVLPTCAYCTETIHIFLASSLHSTEQALDDDEFLSVFWMDLEDVFQLVMRGEIVDSKTVSAILRIHSLRRDNPKYPYSL